MRTPSVASLELERSMNMQCHIMTFEEALRNAQVIDNLDDKRRKKMFGLMKWLYDMNIYFNKRLETVLNSDVNNLKVKLKKFQLEKLDFQEKFFKKLEIIKKDELYYEKLDDDLRNYLIEYSAICRENLRIENSCIEMKIILNRRLKSSD